MSEQYVGVDVSKGHLDVRAERDGTSVRVCNDEAGHQALVARFSATVPILGSDGGHRRTRASGWRPS
jgi:hypothetical protein